MLGTHPSLAVPSPRRGRRRRTWILEGLEERTLLSGDPTTYTVTDLSDSATDTGSLRYAIAQANADTNPAGSLISFDPTTFSSPQTITLSSTLELSGTAGPEVIDGPGAGLVTVSGNHAVRVFQVDSGVTAAIAGLTVAGGLAPSDGAGQYSGGGIDSAGILSVTDTAFSGNSADGGIGFVGSGRGGGINNTGTLSLTACTFTSNSANGAGTTASGPFTGNGGGVNNSGILIVTACTFSGNSARGGSSRFDGYDGIGGAINNSGSLTVTASSFSGNSAIGAGGGFGILPGRGGFGSGGGINNSGILSIAGSSFAGNSTTDGRTAAPLFGGSGGGGGINNSGTLSITGSTFSSNLATGPYLYSGRGGGVENSGTLIITNTTIAYNSASSGGGIYSDSSILTVTDTTIAYNQVGDGKSGGLAGMGTLVNTIVALNTISGGATAADIDGMLSSSSASNLIGSGGSGGLIDGTNGNHVGVTNPELGTLASYGGPTQTIALLPGSPAIDAGLAVAGVTVDQRGIPRPQGAAPDIGAFESRGFTIAIASGDNQTAPALAPFPVPLVVAVASPFGEPVAGGRVSFAAPTAGASLSTPNSAVTIDSHGRASLEARANDLPGNYTVTAHLAGDTRVGFTLANALPPIIVGLQSPAAQHQATALVVTFSAPMDAARAADPTNYRLAWAGHDHRLGTRDDRVIRVRRARYDAASQAVTLRLMHPQPLNRTLWLTIDGTSPGGLTGASGMPLVGVGTGGPAGDQPVRLDLRALRRPMRLGLLPDGDFAKPDAPPPHRARTLFTGDRRLAPWRVTAGSVDVQTYWPAVDGKHSLDLNGMSPGTIEQTFATIPGQAYQLLFDYANNPDAPARASGATVTVTGAGTLLSRGIAHAGSRPRRMNYAHYVGAFLADSTSATVRLASATPGARGIILDAVSIMPVPGATGTTP